MNIQSKHTYTPDTNEHTLKYTYTPDTHEHTLKYTYKPVHIYKKNLTEITLKQKCQFTHKIGNSVSSFPTTYFIAISTSRKNTTKYFNHHGEPIAFVTSCSKHRHEHLLKNTHPLHKTMTIT